MPSWKSASRYSEAGDVATLEAPHWAAIMVCLRLPLGDCLAQTHLHARSPCAILCVESLREYPVANR